MPRYTVAVPVVGTHIYSVYADSPEDAKAQLANGFGRLVDEDSNTVASCDEDEWEVSEDDA